MLQTLIKIIFFFFFFCFLNEKVCKILLEKCYGLYIKRLIMCFNSLNFKLQLTCNRITNLRMLIAFNQLKDILILNIRRSFFCFLFENFILNVYLASYFEIN